MLTRFSIIFYKILKHLNFNPNLKSQLNLPKVMVLFFVEINVLQIIIQFQCRKPKKYLFKTYTLNAPENILKHFLSFTRVFSISSFA